MNFESNRKIEVARTEDEMYGKLEQLKAQGYSESDIHVISKDHAHMSTLNRYSEVSTHEAGTFMDKFKSWFTGEDSVTEGLRKLDLNDAETDRYSKDVASGGFLLYTDASLNDSVTDSHQNEFEEGYDTFGSTGNSYESYHGEERAVQPIEPGFEEKTHNEATSQSNEFTSSARTNFVESRFNETDKNLTGDSTTFGAEEPRSEMTIDSGKNPQSEYDEEQGFEPSTNDFVNETDGRFDEPTDRFARGETFATDPYLAREEDHIGHSMQEDRMVQKNRTNIQDTITNEQQTDGFQSPGADPNLGPAAFGSELNNDKSTEEMKHDFNRDPRTEEKRVFGTEYTAGKHNEPTNQSEEKALNKYNTSGEPEYRETGYENEGHGNAFAFDTNSTENEFPSGGVDEDEDVTTDQYEERLDRDKFLREIPPNSKLF